MAWLKVHNNISCGKMQYLKLFITQNQHNITISQHLKIWNAIKRKVEKQQKHAWDRSWIHSPYAKSLLQNTVDLT